MPGRVGGRALSCSESAIRGMAMDASLWVLRDGSFAVDRVLDGGASRGEEGSPARAQTRRPSNRRCPLPVWRSSEDRSARASKPGARLASEGPFFPPRAFEFGCWLRPPQGPQNSPLRCAIAMIVMARPRRARILVHTRCLMLRGPIPRTSKAHFDRPRRAASSPRLSTRCGRCSPSGCTPPPTASRRASCRRSRWLFR